MAPTLPSARRTSAPPTASRCHPWRRRGRARRSSPPLLTFLFPIGLLPDRLPRPTTPPFQRSAATVILFQTRARRRWLPPSSKRSRRWLGFAPPSSAKRPRR
ncbi:hypothetical protein OsI_18768 [Oryza sativa Indica Group]|uniref:(Rice Genome Annotation Project) expressed protein n=4 Tax=Oryza TaxID=4527 RepID=B7EDC5_ORYSJ|nr:hypothetical protein OsI_18768 [Oryza sativa Indica Group]EEE62618.1 hypothetical protein OsJ_17421 [Oryza sativa Japonica Group]BAG90372.1 unnamed protein product [Oryza sativa Japonica Group]BAG98089.1 unnamed protein product [Oryza sativa Japonica Group]